MTERKTSWQRSINGIDYVPDVGIVCWNVILASGIKIIFSAIHWRLDSLVLSPQLPPLGVVVLFSNSSTENLPTPLVDQETVRQERHLHQCHLH